MLNNEKEIKYSSTRFKFGEGLGAWDFVLTRVRDGNKSRILVDPAILRERDSDTLSARESVKTGGEW